MVKATIYCAYFNMSRGVMARLGIYQLSQWLGGLLVA